MLLIDHTLNDVILRLALQLPECIAYSLSNNIIKLWSIGNQFFILVRSDRISKFSSECCVRNVLVWNEGDNILTDVAQCILGVVATGIE